MSVETRDSRATNWGRGPLFRYMPDEIAILLEESHPGEPTDAAMTNRHTTLLTQICTALAGLANQQKSNQSLIAPKVGELVARCAKARGIEEPTGGSGSRTSAPPADLSDALHAALEPDPTTWDFLRQPTPPLQLVMDPIPLAFPPPIGNPRRPWVILPDGVGSPPPPSGGQQAKDNGPARLRTLHFYQIGSDRLPTVAAYMDEAFTKPGADLLAKGPAIAKVDDEAAMRARRVSDLVKLVNLHPDLLAGNAALAASGVANPSIGAIPNWLCDTTCGGCPCPGSEPVPVPAQSQKGFWGFVFDNSVVQDIVDAQRKTASSDVIVTILDTSPTLSDVGKALARHGVEKNMLLHHIHAAATAATTTGTSHAPTFGNVTIDALGDGSLPQDAFTSLDGITLELRNKAAPYICNPKTERLRIDDHGLFIAGIIHDIAPQAELHLIRALGSFGVTHTNLLLPILQGLPGHFLAGNTKKLIINLSLGWAIPPGDAFLAFWMPEVYAVLSDDLGKYDNLEAALQALGTTYGAATVATIASILDDLHAPIQEVMDFLANGEYKDRILMVAAAGNDNHWLGMPATAKQRPEPRWPARYDQVVGVASVGLQDENAYFSNRGEIASLSNGIATFGGNAEAASPGDLGQITTDNLDPGGVNGVDAVIGIYTAPSIMLSGAGNHSGWVYWAGTSFATPVIAGLAADLWNGKSGPDAAPQAIITTLTTPPFCTQTRQDADRLDKLDTLDCPKIKAHQEPRTVNTSAPLYQ